MSPKTEELEDDYWELPPDETGLMENCHYLRKKEISLLTPEDLHKLTSQKIGVEHILPLVLEVLNNEPTMEAEYYPGDLLFSLIKWVRYQEKVTHTLKVVVYNYCERALAALPAIVRSDSFVIYNEYAPEEFGLTSEKVQELIDEEIRVQLGQTPWKNFSEIVAQDKLTWS